MVLTQDDVRVHQWTKDEYYRIAATGVFNGRHVELIEGQVVDMSPMGTQHITGVDLTELALERAFGAGHFVRTQAPLDLGDGSEPEPDVMVLRGHPRDYAAAHPREAILILEVADTSLAYDQRDKASLYAKAGGPDYWVLNLGQRRLEVRRDPLPDSTQPFGYGYRSTTIFTEADGVAPLGAPQAEIRVADLLP